MQRNALTALRRSATPTGTDSKPGVDEDDGSSWNEEAELKRLTMAEDGSLAGSEAGSRPSSRPPSVPAAATAATVTPEERRQRALRAALEAQKLAEQQEKKASEEVAQPVPPHLHGLALDATPPPSSVRRRQMQSAVRLPSRNPPPPEETGEEFVGGFKPSAEGMCRSISPPPCVCPFPGVVSPALCVLASKLLLVRPQPLSCSEGMGRACSVHQHPCHRPRTGLGDSMRPLSARRPPPVPSPDESSSAPNEEEGASLGTSCHTAQGHEFQQGTHGRGVEMGCGYFFSHVPFPQQERPLPLRKRKGQNHQRLWSLPRCRMRMFQRMFPPIFLA